MFRGALTATLAAAVTLACTTSAHAAVDLVLNQGQTPQLQLTSLSDSAGLTGVTQASSGTQTVQISNVNAVSGTGVSASGCTFGAQAPSGVQTATCPLSAIDIDSLQGDQSIALQDLEIASAQIVLSGPGGTDTISASGSLATALSVDAAAGDSGANVDLSAVTGGLEAPFTDQAGPGGTNVKLGLSGGISAPVIIDSADTSGTSNRVSFAGLSGAISAKTSITLGAGSDSIDLAGATIGASVPLTLQTGDGDGDSIDLANATIGASTQRQTIATGNGASDSVDLASATIGSPANLAITTGNGGDDVALSSTQQGISVQMGSGSNTLNLSSDPNGDSFTYTGARAISAAQGATFSGVDTFDATDGNDTIETTYGPHTINGEGGQNTISYAFEPAGNPVDINLDAATAVATENGQAVTSTIANFQNAIGGAGANTIEARPGGGVLDGGTGTGNTVSFAFEPQANPLTINLAAGSASAADGSQYTITNFQSAVSGDSNTTFIPGPLSGSLTGGPGATNTISFAGESPGPGANVNLAAGSAVAQSGARYAITNIGDVIGGPGNDTVEMPPSGLAGVSFASGGFHTLDFSADLNGTTFSFPAGPTSLYVLGQTFDNVDQVIGTAGANTFDAEGTTDTLDGGPGNDNTLSFAAYGAGQDVTVDLQAGSATTPAGTLSISGFQNVVGGNGNDTLLGADGGSGSLIGGAGDDYIDPRSGNYYINAGTGNDTIAAGTGHNVIVGDGGADTVTFAGQSEPVTIDLTGQADSGAAGQDEVLAGINNAVAGSGDATIIGNAANDLLAGGSGNNTFIPGTGNDTIEGGPGPGTNIVSFADAPANQAVTVNLSDDTATAGNATDRLVAIQGATLGPGPGTLIGGAGAETLNGGGGDDTIIAGSGPDTINTGPGNDYVQAGASPDTITTGAGSDLVQARDGLANTITCGGIGTIVVADSRDTTNNCSNVELPPPVFGGVTPPSSFPQTPKPRAPIPISARLLARFSPARRGFTRVRRLVLVHVAAATNMIVSCRGHRYRACPFQRELHIFSAQAERYNLAGLFGDVPVAPRTQFTLALLAPGAITRTYSFTFRRHERPRLLLRCQPPGESPGPC